VYDQTHVWNVDTCAENARWRQHGRSSRVERLEYLVAHMLVYLLVKWLIWGWRGLPTILSNMLQSFEVPIIEQMENHATSPKQCLSCQLNFLSELSYIPFPSSRTRLSAIGLFLCTSSHHILPVEVLASLDGTPHASASHDLALYVVCFECNVLVSSLPYS
jgi:hypothetical protein